MQRLIFRGLEISSISDNFILQSFNPNEYEAKNREAKTFGVDGAEFYNFTYAPRELTCNGTLCADNMLSLLKLRREAMRIFDGKTKAELTYETELDSYTSMCFARIEFGKGESLFIPFTVTFTLYDFYWKGMEFVYDLGSNTAITNRYTPVYPTITIEYSTSGCDVPMEAGGTVSAWHGSVYRGITSEKFISLTDGKRTLELQYIGDDGETVTINTRNMTVESNKIGDLQNCLTIDSEAILLQNGETVINYTVPFLISNADTGKQEIGEMAGAEYIWYEYNNKFFKKSITVTVYFKENLVGV